MPAIVARPVATASPLLLKQWVLQKIPATELSSNVTWKTAPTTAKANVAPKIFLSQEIIHAQTATPSATLLWKDNISCRFFSDGMFYPSESTYFTKTANKILR